MLRKFFTDLVVVFALCFVVCGAAPELLARICSCPDEVTPKCQLTDELIGIDGQPVAKCNHSGRCGTKNVYRWISWVPPWVECVRVPCACGYTSPFRNACACQPTNG